MLIESIEIKNYRNFENLKINLNDFNIIIGENDIGKTNFVEIIRNILNPTLSYKSVRIDDEDFRDLEIPIIIRIKFRNLENEIIQNIRDGCIDSENCVLLEFKAVWDKSKKEVEKTCYFLREDKEEEQEHQEFYFDLKRDFQFHLIESIRLAKREITGGKRGDLNKLLNFYVPDFLMSFNTLKTNIEIFFNNLIQKVEDYEAFKEIIKKILEIKEILNRIPSNFKEIEKSIEDESNIIRDLNDEVSNFLEISKDVLSRNEDELENGQLEELNNIIQNIIESFNNFKNRFENQELLYKLKKNFSEMEDFKKFNKDLKEILNNILPNIDLDLSFISIQDNELIRKPSFEFDSFPLLVHGTGYQSNFVMSLKILRVFSILKEMDIKSAFIAIEEPEAHIYPHLQRQLINNLKNLQREFKEKYGINLQFIITSHSSNILNRINFYELIIFRKFNESTKSIQLSFNIIDQLVENFCSNSKELKKRGNKYYKGFQNTLSYMFSYYPDLFFSKVVIIGEGETEEGAIPEYAKKLNMDLDSNGITYINARGVGNIKYYTNILDKIKLKYIYILDKDSKVRKKEIKELEEKEFVTERKAFEEEILMLMPSYKILKVFSILASESSNSDRFKYIKSKFPFSDDVQEFEDTINFFKNNTGFESKIKKHIRRWIRNNKGLLYGKLLAESSEISEIPKCYKDAIEKSVELSKYR